MYKKNTKKLEVLIIGMGSIGLRHASIFKDLGCVVSFFRTNNSNLKNPSGYNEYFSINKINKISFDLIAICNPSSMHVEYLKKFKNLSQNFLIEKPLCTNKKDLFFLKQISIKKNIYSGYMFRYDKRILEIKKKLESIKTPKFSSFKWHTYFPDWHKYENFKNSYAANKKLGGGVIFTCSHEIDMAIFFFGKVKTVYCQETINRLNLNVEESVCIFMTHTNGSKSFISIDFTNKNFIRDFKVCYQDKILTYDLKKYITSQEIFKKKKLITISRKNNITKIYKSQNYSILKNIKNNIKISLNIETEKVLLSCFKSIKLKRVVKIL